MESIDSHVARSRIQVEYLEMPGLKLTRAQLGRLCSLPSAACGAAVSLLLQSGFLHELADGSFVRRGVGRTGEDVVTPRRLAAP